MKNLEVETKFIGWRLSHTRRNTEKRNWVNGIQKRGKDSYSFALSFKNIALMFTFAWSNKYISFNYYKLK